MKKFDLKMKKTSIPYLVVLLTISSLFTSCEDPIEYKFQHLPQVVDCPGTDKALMHEALYTFQADIAKAHNFRNYDPMEPMYIINGYRNFVYFGLMGESDFQKIISPHTKKVFDALLKKEPELFNYEGYSNLDYDNEYISCLLENIGNADLQTTILSLKEINSLGPKLMAEPFRKTINDVAQDPYMAMYLALDGYYQYLLDVDLSEVPDVEEVVANE